MNIIGVSFSEGEIFLLRIVGGLFVLLLGSVLYRKNSFFINSKNDKNRKIKNILSPFTDALLNLEQGEVNSIHIMNSLFEKQKNAMSLAKSLAQPRQRNRLTAIWNEYDSFYSSNAKGCILLMFSDIHEGLNIHLENTLQWHMKRIIKTIEKI